MTQQIGDQMRHFIGRLFQELNTFMNWVIPPFEEIEETASLPVDPIETNPVLEFTRANLGPLETKALQVLGKFHGIGPMTALQVARHVYPSSGSGYRPAASSRLRSLRERGLVELHPDTRTWSLTYAGARVVGVE